MRSSTASLSALPLLLVVAHACSASGITPSGTGGSGGTSTSTGGATATSGTTGGDEDDGGITLSDATTEEPPFSPDAACSTAVEEAEATALPVDIIWMIDNSSSMAPAIAEVQAGLNAFTALIGSKSLDYRVIMLSLRSKTSPVQIGGSARYPICIPTPLSGDDNCGNGLRFFQSSIDVRSVQPLEQFLGTLGQTDGYKEGETKGGEPWAQQLRPEATKTIVIVSDDDSRLSGTDFETFIGGKNPFNSLTLPPGILDPSWGGIFDGYLFSGIYGWGSDVDPSVKCTFPDMTQPASAGPTYTTLVNKTGGVRAKICDGQAAWQPFFDAVAQAVISAAKLSCELAIPPPSMGILDPNKVNVSIGNVGMETYLVGVADAAACGTSSGWYYDDPITPTKVILCPAACEQANLAVGPGKPGKVNVIFGCQTVAR